MAQEPSNPLSQLFSRFGLPTDQIAAFQSQLGKALIPGDQLQGMRDLMSTFAPSMDQLKAIENQLKGQRAQLESMMTQLDEIEVTLERLSATSEHLRSMQEPFQRFTRTMLGLEPDDD